MKVLKTGTMPNGTEIQIEEWNENYSFMPYGRTVATYPKAKQSVEGIYSPKANEKFRCEFDFASNEEAEKAFQDLTNGNKSITDFKNNMYDKRYLNCI